MPAQLVWTARLILSWQKTYSNLAILYGRLKETSKRSRRLKIWVRGRTLPATSDRKTVPWTGEIKINHRRGQETDMEKNHETTEVHTCLCAADTKIAMTHETDMFNKTTPVSVIRDHRINRFCLSQLPPFRDDYRGKNRKKTKLNSRNEQNRSQSTYQTGKRPTNPNLNDEVKIP